MRYIGYVMIAFALVSLVAQEEEPVPSVVKEVKTEVYQDPVIAYLESVGIDISKVK